MVGKYIDKQMTMTYTLKISILFGIFVYILDNGRYCAGGGASVCERDLALHLLRVRRQLPPAGGGPGEDQ